MDELFGVGEGACHCAGKDEVEGFSPGPFFFKVVNFEDAVGRNPENISIFAANGWVSALHSWLDRAQINTDNLGLGMSIG